MKSLESFLRNCSKNKIKTVKINSEKCYFRLSNSDQRTNFWPPLLAAALREHIEFEFEKKNAFSGF